MVSNAWQWCFPLAVYGVKHVLSIMHAKVMGPVNAAGCLLHCSCHWPNSLH